MIWKKPSRPCRPPTRQRRTARQPGRRKEANAGSERDARSCELNERQEKAAQYAREIAEKQAQRELLQQEESPDEEIISRIEAELTQLTAEETQNREALAEAEARLNEADAALESVQSQREEAARTAAQAAEQAEQARNDARHAYEKSVEAASETAGRQCGQCHGSGGTDPGNGK